VDIISGTSAGGLNGIFLAKALANDQDMKGLTRLWMEEGDIARLLNDEESVRNEPTLTPAKCQSPQSLLNSERMYDKLLTALHTMDFPAGGPTTSNAARPEGTAPSPLVEELDLFVTTTDLTGLRISIRLDNTVANERRHRNVFHFRYACNEAGQVEENDFQTTINPFLAFSGRCTSSFPFAFEPMQLDDVWGVLRRWPYYAYPEAQPDGGDWKGYYLNHWKKFYSDYTNAGENFPTRAFGDGGYLDNKPFTYATSMLMRRRGTRPVIRKLVYVEPAPEFVPPPPDTESKPNVLDNAFAALLTLPRYETIRDDLQEVIDRNRLLEQIARLTDDLDRIVRNESAQQESGARYRETPLARLIARFGISYAIYHRLKVDAVTRSLAVAITRAPSSSRSFCWTSMPVTGCADSFSSRRASTGSRRRQVRKAGRAKVERSPIRSFSRNFGR
jgi:patatin-related protein